MNKSGHFKGSQIASVPFQTPFERHCRSIDVLEASSNPISQEKVHVVPTAVVELEH
jgi:hypothetical protein